MSAKRVDTSMRLVGDDFCVAARQKQMQTRCELTVWKVWSVNVMTDWKSNSSCIHRGKKRCPGMNSSIQMRVASNWHRLRDKEDLLKVSSMKVGILTRQPWNAVHLSIQVQKTLRYDAVRDQKRVLAVAHDVVRDQSLPCSKDMCRKEVASVEEGREC